MGIDEADRGGLLESQSGGRSDENLIFMSYYQCRQTAGMDGRTNSSRVKEAEK
jgi:hypothetical protein